MIRVANLSFSYNGTRSITFPDFSVNNGEHCLLLGESGSGKTTLLHLLGGLLRGYKGSIQISNTELSTLGSSQLDKFRGQHMGFVFQKNHLIPALTVEKNLLMAPFLAGVSASAERIEKVMAQLGLTDVRTSSVTKISQGQAQRVAIARAVLNNPPIIFADEPTSALDDKNCERVIELLLGVALEYKATLIVATHDQRLKSRIQHQILL